MLEQGAQAPAFTVPDQAGEPVSLEDLRGRWVVVWWYAEADTAG